MKKLIIFLAVFGGFLVFLSYGGCNVSIGKGVEGAVWEKIFDGDMEGHGHCVQQTADGGYIVVGKKTHSHGADGEGIWLIKTDADGNDLWSKTFGRAVHDSGYCVQQTSDGGYIVVGTTGYTSSQWWGGASIIEGEDIWLIKTDTDGNELWNKTFGSAGYDTGYCVQQTSDGGYIILGDTKSYGAGNWDIWLIKTDADGNELWNKTFGGADFDVGYCVQQTSDGGYIAVGTTSSYGADNLDIWLIKTDADGNELWNKTFEGTGWDTGYCVKCTADSGYIIAGCTFSYKTGSSDIWLIKTDADGNELWNKTFVGAASGEGLCVQQTTDGGYIMTGQVRREDNYDIFLVKLSSSGDISWQLEFGGRSRDTASYVIQTTDGNYVITGCIAEPISGFARLSCANMDRTNYYRLFLIKLKHDN